jgi:hypothetical protein
MNLHQLGAVGLSGQKEPIYNVKSLTSPNRKTILIK